MNREIKFRAWITVDVDWEDNDIKEMTYDLAFEEYAPINDLLRIDALMQYTGLCDKNGKEIYEGDICKWSSRDGEVLGTVFWEQQACAFWFKWHDGAAHRYKELQATSGGEIYSIDHVEIIGNIYENPNLLK